MQEGLRGSGIVVRVPVFGPDLEVAMPQRLAAFSLQLPSGGVLRLSAYGLSKLSGELSK